MDCDNMGWGRFAPEGEASQSPLFQRPHPLGSGSSVRGQFQPIPGHPLEMLEDQVADSWKRQNCVRKIALLLFIVVQFSLACSMRY